MAARVGSCRLSGFEFAKDPEKLKFVIITKIACHNLLFLAWLVFL